MVAFFLALMLAAAPAQGGEVCPPIPGKVFKGNFKCKPGLKKYTCNGKKRCLAAPPACAKPPPAKPPVVFAAPVVPPPAAAKPLPPPAIAAAPLPAPVAKPSPWRFSILGEAGPSFCGPEWNVLAGVRVQRRDFHVALQADTLFGRGTLGVQALVYPLQTKYVDLHLNAGVLLQGGHPSAYALERSWDWNLGAGVDVPVYKQLSLVADWAWYRPFSSPAGFSPSDVTKDTCKNSMVVAGVMYTF